MNERADNKRTVREQDPGPPRRTLALVITMIPVAVAAICTGVTILLAGALAIGIRQENLFWLFGGAIVLLLASIVAFLFVLLVCARTLFRQLRMDRTDRWHE